MRIQNRNTGLLFICGSLLLLVPYGILSLRFGYPEILRQDAGEILGIFYNSGPVLLLTWLAFALVGFPLIIGCLKLGQELENEHRAVRWSTTVGVIGLTVQMIALLRWVFVVPVLADAYATGNEMTKVAAVLSFKTLHQFAGVLLGESIGQLFTVIWTFTISLVFMQLRLFPKWLSWLGLISSVIYFSAQTELIHTVMPEIPVIQYAGLVGSTLWLIWLLLLGTMLLQKKL
ncbi:uncharacterized protein DUF4386 [Lacibacter cauensis]|uniref:Uncharacterized protein DUF4386 n=2 Tax=Lacibacter cauensis TaxID=510947 RepID=A0A562SY26_9BACT|nr:uncharacterized protein DUF4386 [Lacibacter cauensis]